MRSRRVCVVGALGVVVWCVPALGQFAEDVDVIHSWVGEAAGDRFGFINRALGDLDGDGAVDVGVGAPDNDEAAEGAGKVYIYSGASGALIRTHVGEENDYLGYEMGGVGDLNGDGLVEYVIGAPGTVGFVSLFGPGRAHVYDGATGNVLHTWVGEADTDAFGALCAGAGNVLTDTAGDVNGDGVFDILVGAASASFSAVNAGRVYVYSGATFEKLYHLDGEGDSDAFGLGLGGLGDIDGDGCGDFVVGAPGAGTFNQGRVYVFSGQTGAELPYSPLDADATGANFGSLFTSGPGDIDGDGTLDIFAADLGNTAMGTLTGRAYVFSGATGALIHQWTGERASEGFGVGRGCGDVDFDGVPDFVISSWRSGLGATFGGKSYVFSGATGETLRTITGRRSGDLFGWSTVGVGDVDGDTTLDFMISSAQNNEGGSNAGKVYVIAGDMYECLPDWNRDGSLLTNDLVAYLNDYNAVAGGGEPVGADPDLAEPFGELNTADLLAYVNAYALGCGG